MTDSFEAQVDRLVQLAHDLAAHEGITQEQALRRIREMLTGNTKPVSIQVDQEGTVSRR